MYGIFYIKYYAVTHAISFVKKIIFLVTLEGLIKQLKKDNSIKIFQDLLMICIFKPDSK